MFNKKINLYATLALFIGLLFTTTAAVAQSQGQQGQGQAATITGQVIDAGTQQAASGVELKIKGTEQTAQTDEKGQFSFSGLEPGTYTITASPEGYEKVSKEVELASSGKKVVIQLKPSGSGSQ